MIVDSSKNFTPERKPMKADAILMHRNRNVIAVRAANGENTIVQVFDLDSRQKLKQFEVPEPVSYWKYISQTKIALVGKVAVYHADITNQDAPARIFER